jgi:quercetin dioxygenase-like cupin family protein
MESITGQQPARLVRHGCGAAFDVAGITIELLISSDEAGYGVMKETVPAGAVIPLHSHNDPESFYLLAGAIQVFTDMEQGPRWRLLQPGDFIHLPGKMKHALRNVSTGPAEIVHVTTSQLGRYFRKIGELVTSGDANGLEKKLRRLSEAHGYRMADPQENSAVGISLA